MYDIERVKPANMTSGRSSPDSASRNSGKTGFTPSFYIRMALKSRHIKDREKRLLSALLRDIERAERKVSIKDFVKDSFSLSLADILLRDSEEEFVDFIETAVFSNQASYEAWLEEGIIIESKKEGAKTIFREMLNNPQKYRIALTMKNRNGSGVVFKDLLSGKTLLPKKWKIAKHLRIGKVVIVRVDNNRVTHVLAR